jgi:hypothetical protein
MTNLVSRKEAREKLGLSDATFRRRLRDLNIQCVSEILPNGMESKKIRYEDFLRLTEVSGKKPTEKKAAESSQELTIYGLKMELVKSQLSLENALKTLQDKSEYINRLEEKNDQLFDQLGRESESRLELMNKISELQRLLLEENKKGFLARLFGRGH